MAFFELYGGTWIILNLASVEPSKSISPSSTEKKYSTSLLNMVPKMPYCCHKTIIFFAYYNIMSDPYD